MHYPTGYYFFFKGNKKYVMYSTLYKSGRFASVHECSDISDEQARGKFLIDHSKEVELLIKQKKQNDSQSKLILS